jgi:hypothetical protein
VKSRVDAQFRGEARTFAFAFTCEQCAHFDPDSKRCANGYPNAPHRARPLEGLEDWVFCKEFELS